MATPTTNSVPVTHLSKSGLANDLAALIDGTKWGSGGYGTGVDLTYSFPGLSQNSASFISGYGEGEWDSWFALNSTERGAVLEALNAVARSADISFTQLADNSTTVGELRFTGNLSMSSFAHAYTPSDGPEAGDAWFSDEWNADRSAVDKGSHDYVTILHEIGHALGLKHPFEGGNQLSDDRDNYLYTVMSYSVNAGDHPYGQTSASFYPTTLMYLDLVALQTLYGQSATANAGNTGYVYYENQTYWETINDSGGIDTITYVSSTGGRIDLSNATFSHMGRAVNFSDGTSTRDTISLGPSVIIENATGGDGNDTLIGNRAANTLNGNAGHDTMTGRAGDDTAAGHAGRDTLVGGSGDDRLTSGGGADRLNGGAGSDTLSGGLGNDRLTGSGSADTLNGGGGNDTLNGGAGNDALSGGPGNDTLIYHAADTSVRGGADTDTLRVLGGGVALDLTAVTDTVYEDIEAIDLTGNGDNLLALAKSDLLELSDTTDQLKVKGNAGDMVDLVGTWADGGAGATYHIYTRGAATILIDNDIFVT